MGKMIGEFMKTFMEAEESGLSSDEDKKQRKQENNQKRPAVLSLSAQSDQYAPGETTLVDVTVQNNTKWPCPLRSI